MADDSRIDYRTSVCDEILLRIISFSDARSILRLSQTCRRFYRICLFDQLRWRRLCLDDFTINLASSAPFPSFRHLYKLLYQSREILKFYLSDSFPISGNYRYGVLPGWLWPWIVLNTTPPSLPMWIRTYHEPFLRFKMSEISLGKVLRVWNLKSSDLPRRLVTRVEYGTCYYRWRDIQMVAMRVHGGQEGLEGFLLKRCIRARGYVERTFERIRCGNFTAQTRGKLAHAQGGEGPSGCQHSTANNEASTARSEYSTTSSELAAVSSEHSTASRHVGDLVEESIEVEME